MSIIESLKDQIVVDRKSYIMKKLEENRKKLGGITDHAYNLCTKRAALDSTVSNADLLAKRQEEVEAYISFGEKGCFLEEETSNGSACLFRNNAIRNNLSPIKLPKVSKLPPYVTWTFLDRNRRMAYSQSILDQKRIYYDQGCGEALFCSDSEEDMGDEEEEKEVFGEFEDYILRKTIQGAGSFDNVLEALARCLGRNACDIKGRYEILISEENPENCSEESENRSNYKADNINLDNDFDAALQPIDNLFCRRCLVFDCSLHGCSQDLVYPVEKQLPFNYSGEGASCGLHCYKLFSNVETMVMVNSKTPRVSGDLTLSSSNTGLNHSPERKTKSRSNQSESASSNAKGGSENGVELARKEIDDENICQPQNQCKLWMDLEKRLFTKGVEIFGKNSCFIASIFLSGMKNCMDVFQYLNSLDKREANPIVDGDDKGKGIARTRLSRRRKSASYNSMRKRITDKKDQLYGQYDPCACQPACGKQCPCLLNGICCEKYCGCPKICKNQFRGCNCSKSQCRSRLCSCFVADRECDPDVCRNCWVRCGDGSFNGPNQREVNYECKNMKLLLRQHQKVLLGRSDVSGWGVFIKNDADKHEYLGEYTGELISHKEADKRGKIYDLENSSFLFNLNDQFVLDAYRKGGKLKFANHSPNPNCYAKIIMVAGDHRVGIFAKERICAGKELFLDYRYEADQAPAWAKKHDAQESKKHRTSNPSTSRAIKLA